MKRVDFIITIDDRQFIGEMEFHDSASFDEAMAAIADDMRREMMSRGEGHREQQGDDV